MATAKQKELEVARKVTKAIEIVNPHGGDEIAYYVQHGTAEHPYYAYTYFRSNRMIKQNREFAQTMDAMMRDVMGRYDRAEDARKTKAEHKATGHTLEVGQVVTDTFSYSSSRTHFWVVEGVTKHTATLRRINKIYVTGDSQHGTVVPAMTEATDGCRRVTVRVGVGNAIKFSDGYSYGRVWNGQPIHEYGD